MKKYILTLVFVLSALLAFGQDTNNYLDSLLATNQDDTLKAKVLYKSAFKLHTSNSDSAEVLTLKILELIPEIHILRNNTYRLQGYISIARSDYHKAIFFFKKALSHVRNKPSRSGLKLKQSEALNLMTIGGIYGNLGDYKVALNYLDTTEYLFKQIKKPIRTAQVLATKAGIYDGLELYDIAEKNYLESILLLENKKDVKSLPVVYINYSRLLRKSLLRYEKALEYLNKTITLAKKQENNYFLASATRDIGRVYTHLERFSEAKQAYKKAEILAKKIKNGLILSGVYSNKSRLFLKINKQDSALFFLQKTEVLLREKGLISHLPTLYNLYAQVWFEKNTFSKATFYAEKSLEINKNQSKNKVNQVDAYDILSKAYKGQGNYKKALHYHELPLVSGTNFEGQFFG